MNALIPAVDQYLLESMPGGAAYIKGPKDREWCGQSHRARCPGVVSVESGIQTQVAPSWLP